ncbi:MAG: DNA polymerase IV, partial [Calditrichaeota bacterium]
MFAERERSKSISDQMKPSGRHIIHIDVADFPIAVERVLEPKLRQRPVVVAVETTTRSLVFSASEEARQQGIFRGMPLYMAKKQCADLRVLPPNEDLYRRATQAMMEVLEKFTPVYEPLRFGHAYLDMTGSTRLFGDVKDAAASIQREMRARLSLGSSAGVAANKLVSKVASDFVSGLGDRFGLYDVRRGDEEYFLAPLSVRYLPGVRNKVYDELRDLNVRIIHDLAEIHVEHLQMVFGRFGQVLHQRALGIDPRPVQPVRQAPEMVEVEQLDDDSNDYFYLLA